MIHLDSFPVQTGYHRVSFYDQFTVTRAHSHRGHGGVDIGSALGTNVHAATDGHVPNSCVIGGQKVPGCGFRQSSGYYVVVVDSQGYFFYYFHLQEKPRLRPGQLVRSRDLLGTMGNSGLSQRSRNAPVHLHFQAVYHLHRHADSEAWYRDLNFPIRNLNNRDPYPQLERVALRLPGARRTRSEVQGVRRRGVIIDPPRST